MIKVHMCGDYFKIENIFPKLREMRLIKEAIRTESKNRRRSERRYRRKVKEVIKAEEVRKRKRRLKKS
jgi:hypothetical protein